MLAAGQAVPLSAAAQLGRQLFFDPLLSYSGRQSCASCHDPKHHYAQANTAPVQAGGSQLELQGRRAVPSLTYLDEVPAFATELTNPDGTASGPGGGLDWDGRADTVAAQSILPLTTAYEMANPDIASVLRRLRQRPAYQQALTRLYGPQIFEQPKTAALALGQALAAFQHEDPSFHPYTSKYDEYVRGLAHFSPAELRGMALFNDAERANCASCHTAGIGPGRDGGLSSAQFTDYFFRNLGVPDNPALNSAPDLGLCGPLRTDLSPALNPTNRRYCGQFMTPSLRNVATRQVFFHNGVFHSLEQVLDFYFTRDITPQRWYGQHRRAWHEASLDREDMPFKGQHPGAKPILSQQEQADIIAFLKTLTDRTESDTDHVSQ